MKTVQQTEDRKETYRLPKNIRQCGKSDPELQIYMEEYVKNYIEERDLSEHDEIKLFILLGEYKSIERKLLFISGAIEISGNSGYYISEEEWRHVYEQIRRYFPNRETVGWVLAGNIDRRAINEELHRAHVQNFGVGSKVLYIYNRLEKREAFFIGETNSLRECMGYYIYYSRNEEMQNYMLEYQEEYKREEEKPQYVIKEADKLKTQERESSRAEEGREQKKGIYETLRKLSYTAAFFLMLVACAVSFVLIQQSDDREKQTVEEKNSLFEQIAENDKEDKKPEEELVQVISHNDSGVTGKSREENGQKSSENADMDTEDDRTEEKAEKKAKKDKKDGNTKSDNADDIKKNDEAEAIETNNQSRKHIVRKGETLAQISRMYYGDVSYIPQIKRINNISDENVIREGEEIRLP